MKTNLMVIVVIAGFLTATYRFLPSDAQQEIGAHLDKIISTETFATKANADNENKRYKLQIPDAVNATKQSVKTLVASAYIQRLEDVQVHDEGRVAAVLTDDRKGSKHQRFILRTKEDISVLVAHNIDLAKRVENLKQGDTVEFYGEYVWNEKGGVVHWTHHDPDGSHVSGWLKHNGVKYQ
jgi:hypothetical protein